MKIKISFLIIGFGSSSQRFIKILTNLNQEITIYKHRKDLIIPNNLKTTTNLKNLKKRFEGVIIASSTSTHYQYLKKILKQKVPILVDKPLTDDYEKALEILNIANQNKTYLQVGFNLRYLKINDLIKDYLKEKKLGKILMADFYVGQYLPFWRPNKKYFQTYSASYQKGGGVALDLIHEIDLACYFFDKPNLKTLFGQKLSNLQIDTEDHIELISLNEPRIKITLDYLNHNKARMYRIIGEKASIECDIINHKFSFTDAQANQTAIYNKNYFNLNKSYLFEIRDFVKKIDSDNQFFKISARDLGIDALRVALKARKHVSRI